MRQFLKYSIHSDLVFRFGSNYIVVFDFQSLIYIRTPLIESFFWVEIILFCVATKLKNF